MFIIIITEPFAFRYLGFLIYPIQLMIFLSVFMSDKHILRKDLYLFDCRSGSSGKRAELFLPSSACEDVLPTPVSGEVLLASASHLLRDPLLPPPSSLILAFPQYRHFLLDGTLILSSLFPGFLAVGAVSSLPHPSLAPGSPAQLGPDLPLRPERCWDVPSTCHRKRNKDTEHIIKWPWYHSYQSFKTDPRVLLCSKGPWV